MTNDEIAQLYDKACKESKEPWRASLWFSEEDAYMNYSIVSNITASGDSVLDVGCGQGGLYDVLTSRFTDIRYHGIDISGEMISRASAKRPGVRFSHGDFLSSDLEPADKVIAIGAFSFRSEKDQYEYLRECLEKCFRLCNKKVAVTMTTMQADVRFDNSNLFYYCPIKVHEIASEITPYYTINTMSISCEMIVILSKLN